jgi:hypothetical protein
MFSPLTTLIYLVTWITYIPVQSDLKVTQPIPNTCCICQKIILKSENKKQHIKGWKCPPFSAMHAFSLFLMSDACFLCPASCFHSGSPDQILFICLAQENKVMYPQTHSVKLHQYMRLGCVQQWTLIVLLKRHPCTLTRERQLMDWHEHITT